MTRQRVLVALDAARASLEALSAGAALAQRLQGEVEALLVEDVDLLRLAAFPGAAQLTLPSGSTQPVDPRRVETELRAVAATAREALAATARAHGVAWSLRVERGRPSEQLSAAATSADLLVITWEVARRALLRAQKPVLLMRRGGVGRRLAVVYDGSAGAQRALAFAATLAGAPSNLTLLVPGTSRTAAERTGSLAALQVGLPDGSVAVRWTGARSDRIGERSAGALVVFGGRVGDAFLQRILDETDGPVLVVP